MKAMVYAHKVNTREELLQRIISAARSINNAAVLRKITSSLIIRVRRCIQADGGHFEQLAWVLNGESVTVHLTTQLNKCTMFLFLIYSLYFNYSSRLNRWEFDPCVYDAFDSESALQLNPEVVTLTPGTPCIRVWDARVWSRDDRSLPIYREDL